jgi:hypothetical protein
MSDKLSSTSGSLSRVVTLEEAGAQALGVRRIEQALEALPMRSLMVAHGEAPVKVAVTALTMKAMGYFAPAKRMTPEQNTLFAEKILEDYPYESLADVAVFLRGCATGKYDDGKTYGALDVPLLSSWWKRYIEEKVEVRERELRRQQHESSTQMTLSLAKMPQVVEVVKSVNEKSMVERKERDYIERIRHLEATVGKMTDDELRHQYVLRNNADERSIIMREAHRRGLLPQEPQPE